MKAAVLGVLIAAFSSATVWAQPPRSSTNLDLKRLSVEFDEQSRELNYISFELWPPNREFIMDCSNSRRFQVLRLPVFPLKVRYPII